MWVGVEVASTIEMNTFPRFVTWEPIPCYFNSYPPTKRRRSGRSKNLGVHTLRYDKRFIEKTGFDSLPGKSWGCTFTPWWTKAIETGMILFIDRVAADFFG